MDFNRISKVTIRGNNGKQVTLPRTAVQYIAGRYIVNATDGKGNALMSENQFKRTFNAFGNSLPKKGTWIITPFEKPSSRIWTLRFSLRRKDYGRDIADVESNLTEMECYDIIGGVYNNSETARRDLMNGVIACEMSDGSDWYNPNFAFVDNDLNFFTTNDWTNRIHYYERDTDGLYHLKNDISRGDLDKETPKDGIFVDYYDMTAYKAYCDYAETDIPPEIAEFVH